MSNNNIAISFENVSKMYRLGLVGTGTLGQDLNRWWKMNVLRQEDPYLKIGQTNDRSTKGSSDFVYALKDIDFKVEQGDVLGIIGKNGAGKSTLLKLLSRITAPTTGQIKTRGRLASLLEVGTGFHPELTGRENIYMNGSIMGMTKAEITRKLDEIIDFAGVERYIDTPCKRYSSGMQVRLGFAVAAFLEPEILVVDEVLAVGDAEFQKKAIGKMKDVTNSNGRTVLFVSHNMTAVRSLCKTGILLENGMLKETGTIESVVAKYLHEDNGLGNHRICEGDREFISDDGGVELIEIGTAYSGNDFDTPITMDHDFDIVIRYRLKKKYDNFWVTMFPKNGRGDRMFSVSSPKSIGKNNHPTGEFELRCKIPADFFNWGNYGLDVMFFYDGKIKYMSDIISYTINNKQLEIGSWMGREPGDITPSFAFTEFPL